MADWIWVARQRAAGRDYVSIPYTTAVGALVVREDSDVQALPDLEGGQVGIAGGPLDKSWLILRAYTEREHGFDLADVTEQVYGAPPLITKTAMDGDTDGAIKLLALPGEDEGRRLARGDGRPDRGRGALAAPEHAASDLFHEGRLSREEPRTGAGALPCLARG